MYPGLKNLTTCVGTPCDANGHDLVPADTLPTPPTKQEQDDFFPYDDRVQFELADLIFRRNQMPAHELNDLLILWAATIPEPPYVNHQNLYETIDSTTLGDAPWSSFSVEYTGDVSGDIVPPWKMAKYDVWMRNPRTVFRNQLSNPDFDGEIDYAAKWEFNTNGKRVWRDLMSGNWAWEQSVRVRILSPFISSSSITGHNCKGHRDAWLHVRPCYPRKR